MEIYGKNQSGSSLMPGIWRLVIKNQYLDIVQDSREKKNYPKKYYCPLLETFVHIQSVHIYLFQSVPVYLTR